MISMRNGIPLSAKSRARAMRREPTEAERKLWYALRDRRMQALKFRRQAPVGPYIVDFLCVAHRLIVEADGSQHVESKRDAIRDEWLMREGHVILRFSNRDILTARESVLATIAAKCGLPW
jgi:very-short-patch-repair endonuclease